jgi:hypothetical protein
MIIYLLRKFLDATVENSRDWMSIQTPESGNIVASGLTYVV